jgi:hypothetical protein
MRRYINPASVVVALMLLAGAANANMISYGGTMDFGNTGTQTLNLQQFDTSLGTLTAVTIYVAHSGGAFFNVDNDDNIAVQAFAEMDRGWTLTDVGLNVSNSHTTTTAAVDLTADDGDAGVVDFTPDDGHSWPSVSFNDPDEAYVINNANWAAYQGLGTLGLQANVTNFVNAIGYVDTAPNQVATYMANLNPGLRLNARIEYQYETDYVPEPCTMTLLSLGVLGIGAWRRRKRAA